MSTATPFPAILTPVFSSERAPASRPQLSSVPTDNLHHNPGVIQKQQWNNKQAAAEQHKLTDVFPLLRRDAVSSSYPQKKYSYCCDHRRSLFGTEHAPRIAAGFILCTSL